MTNRAYSFLVIVLVGAVPTFAVAQVTSATLNSSLVTGFETPFAWGAKSSSSSKLVVSSTIIRTQGSYAYLVSNPGNLVTLTSAPVNSNATALGGIGAAGSIFEVDAMLPSLVGNTNNTGQMQMYVNSPSRGLSKVLVGNILFSNFRTGLYSTLQFPVPGAVRSALAGATFSDLTFILMISSPGQLTGPYLFDNLRVHSVQLVTTDASTVPPPGFGGSVDFVVIGGAPVTQSFNIGVIQVPDSFHLKLGTAGTTKVLLALGYEGTPSFTCTYNPDFTDKTGRSYIWSSCDGGIKPGDMVGADWASLTISGGNNNMKLRAQLAENPMGDVTGSGLLPPMPTFWGDFDGCAPNAVAGGISPPFASPSASCAAQIAQANQIVTNYFNRVQSANVAPNWIVTPKPEFSRRHGDGSPHDNLTGPPPLPNDPDFDQEGHMNPGGDWDAYWRLNGYVTSDGPTGPSGYDFTADLNATLSGHVVLFGEDANVVSINATVHTDVGPTNLSNPNATGSLNVYVFGAKIPTGGDGSGSANAQVCFGNFSAGDDQEYSVGAAQIWIFVVNLGAKSHLGITAGGCLSTRGFDFQFDPEMQMGVHAYGGVGIAGIVSGGVDVSIDKLLDAKVPVSADVTWNIDTAPTQCDAQVTFSANSVAEISSGGGEVDLVATFGDCPFCKDVSWEVFSWDSLGESFQTLFNSPSTTLAAVGLPNQQSSCSSPLTVSIVGPNGGSLPSTLQAPGTYPLSAGISGPAGAASTSCSWSFNPTLSGDIVPIGCSGQAFFQNGGSRSIKLTVSQVFNNSFGQVTDQGTGQGTVNVVALAPGAYVYSLTPFGEATDFVIPSQQPSQPVVVPVDIEGAVSSIDLKGQVVGATGPTSTTWTITSTGGGAPVVLSSSALQNGYTTATWNFPTLLPGQSASYYILMTTTQSGSQFGSSQIRADLTFPPQ